MPIPTKDHESYFEKWLKVRPCWVHRLMYTCQAQDTILISGETHTSTPWIIGIDWSYKDTRTFWLVPVGYDSCAWVSFKLLRRWDPKRASSCLVQDGVWIPWPSATIQLSWRRVPANPTHENHEASHEQVRKPKCSKILSDMIWNNQPPPIRLHTNTWGTIVHIQRYHTF